MRRSIVLLVPVLALACAARDFDAARRQDTAAAYHKFLRDHPRSSRAEEARERLELARVRANPRVEGYEAFAARWPESPLLPELRALVETPAFERARALGTPEAYEAFLADFPDGALATRARGNRIYLAAAGYGGRPAALAEFAAAHPESDFAAEAARTARSLDERRRSAFRRVGLLLDVSSATPGAERLGAAFVRRAAEAFAAAGVEVVPLAGPDDPRGASLPVRLSIRHDEGEERPSLEQGRMASGGHFAETRVELRRVDGERPIWSRTVRFRAPGPSQREDTSLLFGAGSEPYWAEFFVPVATWDTHAAVRSPQPQERDIAAIETVGARSLLLLDDGSVRVLDLSDPEQPIELMSRRRERDLKRFGGIRLFRDRVVVFGDDGAELVRLSSGGSEVEAVLERGSVGSILAVEEVDGRLVAATTRGLLVLPEAPGEAPEVLVPRPIADLALLDGHLLFLDRSSLFVSTPALLRRGRVVAEVALGPGVVPRRVRAAGRSAVVVTDRGALWLDLATPSAPGLRARFDSAEVGELTDAFAVGDRIFLLGARGLQLAGAANPRVVASADVEARSDLRPMGRHLVMVGERWLQVVDATPFLVGPTPAAAP